MNTNNSDNLHQSDHDSDRVIDKLTPTDTSHLSEGAINSDLPATDSDLSNTNLSNTSLKDVPAAQQHSHKDGFVGHLELLEERSVVNKERLDVGKVTVTKHSLTKTVEVPIELVEEYITIQTDYSDAESEDLLSGDYDDKDILRHVEPALDSKAVVTVNGKQVEIGDAPIEIALSRQVATITKETFAIQDVNISKTTHTHTDTIQVELQHEELDVVEEGRLAHDHEPTSLK